MRLLDEQNSKDVYNCAALNSDNLHYLEEVRFD